MWANSDGAGEFAGVCVYYSTCAVSILLKVPQRMHIRRHVLSDRLTCQPSVMSVSEARSHPDCYRRRASHAEWQHSAASRPAPCCRGPVHQGKLYADQDTVSKAVALAAREAHDDQAQCFASSADTTAAGATAATPSSFPHPVPYARADRCGRRLLLSKSAAPTVSV